MLQHSPHNNALNTESLEALTNRLAELHLLVKTQSGAAPLRGSSHGCGNECFSYGKTGTSHETTHPGVRCIKLAREAGLCWLQGSIFNPWGTQEI